MKYKIAIISPYLDLNGGGEKLIINLGENLNKKKYEVTFYSPNINTNCWNYLISKKFRVKNLSISSQEESRYSYDLEQYHHQIEFNHLYICNHIELSKLRLFPKILYAHEDHRLSNDLYFEEPLWDLNQYSSWPNESFLSKKMNNYRNVNVYDKKFPPNHIFVNSYKTKKQIEELTQNKNISVLYPGVDLKKKILAKDKKQLDFIVLGVIAYHKRYDLILDLASIHKDINFHFVGRGPEYKSLLNYIGESDYKNCFVYNDVTDNYLAKLMSKMDCLINLSINEPFGMNVIEAASMGLPVITDNQAGACEFLSKNLLKTEFNLVKINKCINKIKNFNYRKKISKEIDIKIKLNSWKKFGKLFESKIKKILSEYKNNLNKNFKSILYRVDYPWYIHTSKAQIDKSFNGKMPILGRYRSSSQTIIIEHFNQIKRKKIDYITFLIDFDHESAGMTKKNLFNLILHNIERVLIINELYKFNFKFNFGLKNFQSFPLDLDKFIKKISQNNFRSVASDKIGIIFLNEPERARFFSESYKYPNNIKFYLEDDRFASKLNNVKKIEITSNLKKFFQNKKNPIIFNAFNDYIGSATNLEKIIK